MKKPELQNLIEALKEGVVTVVFKKINTEEIRVMPCTINEAILKDNGIKVVLKKLMLTQIILLHGQLIKKHGDLFELTQLFLGR